MTLVTRMKSPLTATWAAAVIALGAKDAEFPRLRALEDPRGFPD